MIIAIPFTTKYYQNGILMTEAIKLKKIVKNLKSWKRKGFRLSNGYEELTDSSYLLYIMVTKYDLRPLVFRVDAGWNSQIAVNNIEKLETG